MKQIGLIGTWLVFCLDGVEKIFSRPKKGKVKYILLSVLAAYIINISTGAIYYMKHKQQMQLKNNLTVAYLIAL
ncbi:hypothetical protein [Terrisporobacter petrolearius]|uniref:hypothetical protein n=1 Tax=Terrisporobacter petrolearius TaxID=1460447 RepID=UPI003EB91C68